MDESGSDPQTQLVATARDAFTRAFHTAAWVSAALGLLAAVVSMRFMKKERAT